MRIKEWTCVYTHLTFDIQYCTVDRLVNKMKNMKLTFEFNTAHNYTYLSKYFITLLGKKN
jgi:hypothetical protein